jgi:plastocyanin
MKKIYLFLVACIGFNLSDANATTHTITIVGQTYSPSMVNAVVGDEIIISASGGHPLVQVDQATWDASSATPMVGGWGTLTSSHTFTVTEAGDIYFVCQFHVGMGMKGMISVSAAVGIQDFSATEPLSVYPNLVSDGVITVKGDQSTLEGSTLQLISANGQLVKSVAIQSERIALGNLAAGMYSALVVKNEKVIHRQKLVVVPSAQ